MAKHKRLNKAQVEELQRFGELLKQTQKGTVNVDEVEPIEQTQKVEQSNKPNFKQIKLSQHAIQRSKERFKMNAEQATGYFRSILPKAIKIGLQKAEDGNTSILYGYGRIGIFVSPDYTQIITVMKNESVTYEPIKAKVAELHAKELRKLTRKEHTLKRKFEDYVLEAEVEIANLKLRAHRSRSNSVKNACRAKIEALKMSIKDKEQELKEIESIKRQVARSMLSVI